MAQIILTPEARNHCHLEVFHKALSAELGQYENEEDGQMDAIQVKGWYIKEDAEWARVTIPLSEINSIQDTAALLKGFPDASRYCILDVLNMPPILVNNTYEDIRALVYGMTTVPIINLCGN